MTTQTWSRDWTRAFLSPCVLAVLAKGPNHGYAIAQRLQQAGLGPVKGGTLYPLLARLEQDGLLHVMWLPGEGGPGRKVFALTATGTAAVAQLSEEWATFTDTISPLLNDHHEGTTS